MSTALIAAFGAAGCGDNGIAPPDAPPIDATPEQDAYVGPSISDVPDQTIDEDGTTGSLGFTVSDTSVAAGSLTVTATSNNTTVIPDANVVLGGTGANRTVTVTAAANQFGSATITLTVNNGQGKTATSDFTVTVTSTNDAPTITAIADQTVAEGQPTTALAFTVADADTLVGSLVITASSSNLALVPASGLTLGGTGANRTITVTPATTGTGSSTITVSVSDGTTTTTETFLVTVTFTSGVNDAPVITVPGAQTTSEDVPLVFGPGSLISVSDIDAGTAAVSVTLTTTIGTLTLSNTSGLTFVTGDGTADTTMTFTGNLIAVNNVLNGMTLATAANASGNGVVTISVNDQGNSGTGGAQSDTDTVNVSVVAVNDLPTVSQIANQTIAEDGNTGGLNFTIGDVETPAGSLVVTATSGNQTLVPDANISLSGAGAARTIIVTPVANQFGSAIITVTVSDGTGSTTMTFTVTVTAGNDAPTITPDLQNTSMNLGAPQAFNFTIGDAETAVGSLTLTATSSDQSVLPNLNVVLTGTGAARTLTVNPTAVGTTTITITVGDGTTTTVDTFILVVNNFNDPPVNTVPGTQAFNAITNSATAAPRTLAFSVANGNAVSVTDPDSGANNVEVTIVATNGVVDVPTTTGVAGSVAGPAASMTLTGTVANVNLALAGLTFTSTQFFFGAATLTVTTSDLGNSGTPTTVLTDMDSITVNVNARPRITLTSINPTTANTNEDVTFTGTFTVSDDDGTVANITTTATSNRPTLIASVTGGGTTALRTLTAVPVLNRNVATDGTATITITATDALGGTITQVFPLTVNQVNDNPVNAVPAAQTSGEDVPLVFSTATNNAITFTDVDLSEPGGPVAAGRARVQLSVTSGCAGCTLTLSPASASLTTQVGNNTGSIDMTGTRAALLAALDGLRINPPLNTVVTAGVLQVLTEDRGNAPGPSALTDTDTIGFTFTAVNDAPTHANVSGLETITQTANPPASRTALNVDVLDVDAGTGALTVTVAATNGGTVTLASLVGLTFATGDGTADTTMTFSGSLTNINAALGAFSLQSPAGFTGDIRVSVTTNDNGNVGSGGSGSATSNIITTFSVAANTPPMISMVADQTITEDSSTAALAFTISDFETDESNLLNDVDVTATSSNPNFTVTLGGSAGARTVTVTPDANYNTTGDPVLAAAGPATITLTVNDGTGADAVDTFTVVVTAVNDAPVISPNPIPTQTTDEDIALVVSYTTTDVDNVIVNGNMVSFTDQPTLLTLNSVTTSAVSYSPAANLSGNANVTLSVTDGTLTTVRTFVAVVTAVNDAPTVTNSGDLAGNRLAVNDLEQTTLSIEIFGIFGTDTFSLGTTAGLTFPATVGPLGADQGFTVNGDGVNDFYVYFTGTTAAINAALDDLESCTDAGCGGDFLVVEVSDQVGGTDFTFRTTPFGPN